MNGRAADRGWFLAAGRVDVVLELEVPVVNARCHYWDPVAPMTPALEVAVLTTVAGMRRGGGDSWRFACDVGRLPHAVLYVRDALRLPVGLAESIPPPLVGDVPNRSELLEPSARVTAGRQWALWWVAVVDSESRAQRGSGEDRERYGRTFDPATSPALARDPVLRSAAGILFGEGCKWADTARDLLLPPASSGSQIFEWSSIRGIAEAVAAEAGVGVEAVSGAASVLLVEGVWWVVEVDGFALCSLAAARDPDLSEDILRETFRSSLSRS